MSLVSSAYSGDTAQIKKLLDQGVDVNAHEEGYICNIATLGYEYVMECVMCKKDGLNLWQSTYLW